MISVSRIMSGGLVATGLDQIMPLGSIRDCLGFAGERALLRSSRRGVGSPILIYYARIV